MASTKTKILAYSKTELNKVVSRYVELEKVNDDVYIYVEKKDEMDSDWDRLGVVFKIQDVYFHEGEYSRRNLSGQDVGGIGSDYVANFKERIETTMEKGGMITLLMVRVYQELGWDTALLLKYRDEHDSRIEKERSKKKEERRQKEEQEQREKDEADREQLINATKNFLNGEYIATSDFINLLRLANIEIPLRTHGTLNKSVVSLNIKGNIKYMSRKGKRDPKLDGCFKLIELYKTEVTKAKSEITQQ